MEEVISNFFCSSFHYPYGISRLYIGTKSLTVTVVVVPPGMFYDGTRYTNVIEIDPRNEYSYAVRYLNYPNLTLFGPMSDSDARYNVIIKTQIFYFWSYAIYKKLIEDGSCNLQLDWKEDNCKLLKVKTDHITILHTSMLWLLTFITQLVNNMISDFNCLTPWLINFAR